MLVNLQEKSLALIEALITSDEFKTSEGGIGIAIVGSSFNSYLGSFEGKANATHFGVSRDFFLPMPLILLSGLVSRGVRKYFLPRLEFSSLDCQIGAFALGVNLARLSHQDQMDELNIVIQSISQYFLGQLTHYTYQNMLRYRISPMKYFFAAIFTSVFLNQVIFSSFQISD